MDKEIHEDPAAVQRTLLGRLDKDGNIDYKAEHTVFTTEPQLWYNVGQHFGCENLSVGSEVEISHNFGSNAGWMVRPCLGVKWDF
jgi:hypothetical protein